ncbi:helix-turn-helix domain-containing protein [Eubacterium aggregans]|uniref:helix-turn-helix domain-containing protein n=1 Tax=Eubacterium aggregans TaxID=81409 RepID=UPI003F3D74F9
MRHFPQHQTGKKLLRSKDEIAVELGYRDIDYFSRVFKKETGHSPSTYREEGNHEG